LTEFLIEIIDPSKKSFIHKQQQY